MRPFTIHTGIAAALLRDNIDTDAIIPSRQMSRVSRDGLGNALFAGWRYEDDALTKPINDFVLNKPRYRSASILLGGNNFGCGSSREHAVWALDDFGIRVIIASSFGAIFESNCFRNGVLPIVMSPDQVKRLAGQAHLHTLTVDLEKNSIIMGELQFSFSIPQRQRKNLLDGADHISETLVYAKDIDAARQRRRALIPWAEI